MSSSNTTTDHSKIKKWIESRNGVPAKISNTGSENDGLLRVHYPEASKNDDSFDEISWDEFFEIFDKNNLAFLYQDEKKDGEESTFSKFVAKEKK